MSPRSHAADAARELHALPRALPGPYRLVGHSYGGLVMPLYASAYPSQVDGLVLVSLFRRAAAARSLNV